MNSLTRLHTIIEERITAFRNDSVQDGLNTPISYIMGIGGKRMRPILTLMSTELFGENITKSLDCALAVEVFHNFTLMHDDIMDKAPLRRGVPTVHEKWDTNTAILSGDAMMIAAYRLLSSAPADKLPALLNLFNTSAYGVCVGQQMDMAFESRKDVSVEEYLEMIRLKTAVLLGCALELGAIMAGAGEEDRAHIRAFGENLGISFQLRDDYLDAFGDPEKFGKQVGGDILADKKTYLLIKALNHSDQEQKETLLLHQGPAHHPEHKVNTVKSIMMELGLDQEIQALAGHYYEKAQAHLEAIDVPAENKEPLNYLAAQLLNRQA